MERWVGKVAIVTGASSGIGEAISIALVQHGVKVVGMARRLDRMDKIKEQLKSAKGTFHPVKCDVTKEEDILEAFKFAETLGDVDILVNNAGVTYPETVIDGTTENYKNVMDVNLVSPAICTREASRSMRKRGASGHIVNINSVAGQNVSKANAPLNLYHASKFALRAMSEVVRNELIEAKAPIKVTNLSPGLVKTDMPIKAIGSAAIFDMLPSIEPKDIADGVIYVLSTPPNVQVTELTITPLPELVKP